MDPKCGVSLVVVVGLLLARGAFSHGVPYPPTRRVAVVDTLHGVAIPDPYRWLEDGNDPLVKEWTRLQELFARGLLDTLPQRQWLRRRLEELWRHEDRTAPVKVVEGSRTFFWVKHPDQDRWVYMTQAHDQAPAVVVIDPNEWPPSHTLDLAVPSRDGRFLAFGVSHGGDENPIVRVMEVASGRILPDSLRGWRCGGISWLPDRSGFFYSAHPTRGEVPPGEEFYWHRVFFHRLGSPAAEDRVVFSHDEVKEYYHSASVTEDGGYVVYTRSRFGANEVYLGRVQDEGPPRPVATGFEAEYAVEVVDGRLFIVTDEGAPRGRVFVASVEEPSRPHWREFIPESEDNLRSLDAICGMLYLTYSHHATTRIVLYDRDGTRLRELPLPGLGSASVSGSWSKPPVWVSFSSYTSPRTIFTYDVERDELHVFFQPPVPVDVGRFATEQVWYRSKDGTMVSMFLIGPAQGRPFSPVPVLLTGYGGFNIPLTPSFSASYVAWIEAGGMVAIPNLRGGGEYGRQWHEAGTREHKQNVFDDFVAAAEWLIAQGITSPPLLAIEGGSNGGLLVGAVAMQRPDLFGAVLCEVPLLDMLRYHRFGLANIWAEEYGSADDPALFPRLKAYSPYHNVREGVRYPPMLFVAGENDARVDPAHARKMVALLQATDQEGGPFLLLVQRESGHGGGTTLSRRVQQRADAWGFLMNHLGMTPPG